ncbi:NF-kappa pathway inhibitor [Orf virus]|uniref:NF-kappa pathway inhibitor n=1 Tax=Orf virus TaxID=10258 RepID=A0A7U0TJJ8_ORFV|nr:NF-kappa pathway inhibitor [Orf virus]
MAGFLGAFRGVCSEIWQSLRGHGHHHSSNCPRRRANSMDERDRRRHRHREIPDSSASLNRDLMPRRSAGALRHHDRCPSEKSRHSSDRHRSADRHQSADRDRHRRGRKNYDSHPSRKNRDYERADYQGHPSQTHPDAPAQTSTLKVTSLSTSCSTLSQHHYETPDHVYDVPEDSRGASLPPCADLALPPLAMPNSKPSRRMRPASMSDFPMKHCGASKPNLQDDICTLCTDIETQLSALEKSLESELNFYRRYIQDTKTLLATRAANIGNKALIYTNDYNNSGNVGEEEHCSDECCKVEEVL